jgi:HEPN domain-containing protein
MRTVKILLEKDNFDTDIVTFHCQKAIEKYFKAFLLGNGWKLGKIHNLDALSITK